MHKENKEKDPKKMFRYGDKYFKSYTVNGAIHQAASVAQLREKYMGEEIDENLYQVFETSKEVIVCDKISLIVSCINDCDKIMEETIKLYKINTKD